MVRHLRIVFGKEEVLFKNWIVLYTCAASRDVVLDLVPGLHAKSFRRSLVKFISRKVYPDEAILDNGTNFVAKKHRLL